MFIEKLNEQEKIECMEYVYSRCEKHLENKGGKVLLDHYNDNKKVNSINTVNENLDILDHFVIEDFTCSNQDIWNKKEMLLSYRTYMYNKFGKEYLQALKQHLINQKNKTIKELIKKIEKTEEYHKEIIAELNNEIKKLNNKNDNILIK